MAGADISLIYDECSDNLVDEGFDQGDCSSASSPLEDERERGSMSHFQMYSHSKELMDSQMLPREVQTMFSTSQPQLLTKELPNLMARLVKLGNETIQLPSLLKQIPDIAEKAIDNSERVEALKDVVGDYLIPLVVRNIGSFESEVDKAANSALIELIKRGYVTKFQAEIKICPSVLALSKNESDSYVITGIIRFMSHLATLLGRDITERIFLKRYMELCSSKYFHTRKLAVDHIGYFCAIVSKDVFEKNLLPCYLSLCQDEIWGIRKSCAEVIIFISCACPSDLRKTLLTDAFLKLLHDEHRWVKMLAFQSLGPFIVSFANPPLTTIQYDYNGDVVLANHQGDEFQPCCPPSASLSARGELYFNLNFDFDNAKYSNTKFLSLLKSPTNHLVSIGLNTDDSAVQDSCSSDNKENANPLSVNKDEPKHEDDLLSYNEYNYWYISPPDIDVEVLDELDEGPKTDSTTNDLSAMTSELETMYATISLNDNYEDISNQSIIPPSDIMGDNLVENSTDVDNSDTPTTTTTAPKLIQDIVPQELVDYYVSMVNSENNTDEIDLSYLCAYTFPAVVLTLGRENWLLLRDVVNILAGHVSYKIRRIIASSLHELAVILGTENTNDLTLLFEGFLKDLDEVRIEMLKHLSDFFELLSQEKRLILLPKLRDFLRVDNVYNWRFEETLAQQLALIIKYFEPTDIAKHIGIHAQALMWYNVAAVRHAAINLVTQIVKRIAPERGLTSSYLVVIAERYAHSKRWKPRQTFALLCSELLRQKALDSEEFASVMWPHLLDLSWDPVANIKIMVAKCIVEHIITDEYFIEEYPECLRNVLRRLQTDKDRDVRLTATCSF